MYRIWLYHTWLLLIPKRDMNRTLGGVHYSLTMQFIFNVMIDDTTPLRMTLVNHRRLTWRVFKQGRLLHMFQSPPVQCDVHSDRKCRLTLYLSLSTESFRFHDQCWHNEQEQTWFHGHSNRLINFYDLQTRPFHSHVWPGHSEPL
jgi:hypothetical protein